MSSFVNGAVGEVQDLATAAKMHAEGKLIAVEFIRRIELQIQMLSEALNLFLANRGLPFSSGQLLVFAELLVDADTVLGRRAGAKTAMVHPDRELYENYNAAEWFAVASIVTPLHPWLREGWSRVAWNERTEGSRPEIMMIPGPELSNRVEQLHLMLISEMLKLNAPGCYEHIGRIVDVAKRIQTIFKSAIPLPSSA
ncbi:MAG TPA: hypothetical protein VGE35_01790 [Candidatus Paceibacterota bacterium]